eukprot:XP_001691980.1 predicted protein [Chlamydomonas reinhardtii]
MRARSDTNPLDCVQTDVPLGGGLLLRVLPKHYKDAPAQNLYASAANLLKGAYKRHGKVVAAYVYSRPSDDGTVKPGVADPVRTVLLLSKDLELQACACVAALKVEGRLMVIVHASTSPKFVRVLLLALGRVAAEAASQPYLLAVAQENEGDFLAPLGFKHPRLQAPLKLVYTDLAAATSKADAYLGSGARVWALDCKDLAPLLEQHIAALLAPPGKRQSKAAAAPGNAAATAGRHHKKQSSGAGGKRAGAGGVEPGGAPAAGASNPAAAAGPSAATVAQEEPRGRGPSPAQPGSAAAPPLPQEQAPVDAPNAPPLERSAEARHGPAVAAAAAASVITGTAASGCSAVRRLAGRVSVLVVDLLRSLDSLDEQGAEQVLAMLPSSPQLHAAAPGREAAHLGDPTQVPPAGAAGAPAAKEQRSGVWVSIDALIDGVSQRFALSMAGMPAASSAAAADATNAFHSEIAGGTAKAAASGLAPEGAARAQAAASKKESARSGGCEAPASAPCSSTAHTNTAAEAAATAVTAGASARGAEASGGGVVSQPDAALWKALLEQLANSKTQNGLVVQRVTLEKHNCAQYFRIRPPDPSTAAEAANNSAHAAAITRIRLSGAAAAAASKVAAAHAAASNAAAKGAVGGRPGRGTSQQLPPVGSPPLNHLQPPPGFSGFSWAVPGPSPDSLDDPFVGPPPKRLPSGGVTMAGGSSSSAAAAAWRPYGTPPLAFANGPRWGPSEGEVAAHLPPHLQRYRINWKCVNRTDGSWVPKPWCKPFSLLGLSEVAELHDGGLGGAGLGVGGLDLDLDLAMGMGMGVAGLHGLASSFNSSGLALPGTAQRQQPTNPVGCRAFAGVAVNERDEDTTLRRVPCYYDSNSRIRTRACNAPL